MHTNAVTQTHCLLKITLSRRRREAYGHDNRKSLLLTERNPIRHSSIG